MLHHTRGIVLRTVKYGETSLIALVYTERFGVQSYMVNGVRSSNKSALRPGYFQPSAQLELVVYHNELRNIQRIREGKWHFLYQEIFFDMRKNAVALFMVELLQKTIHEPEGNSDLYAFAEDAFQQLDAANIAMVANFPLYFSLHLSAFFGFRIQDNFQPGRPFLDLQEGLFVEERPAHQGYIEGEGSAATAQLLKVMQPSELQEVMLTQSLRRRLLDAYMQFYNWHVSGFNTMRSLPVLQEVMNA